MTPLPNAEDDLFDLVGKVFTGCYDSPALRDLRYIAVPFTALLVGFSNICKHRLQVEGTQTLFPAESLEVHHFSPLHPGEIEIPRLLTDKDVGPMATWYHFEPVGDLHGQLFKTFDILSQLPDHGTVVLEGRQVFTATKNFPKSLIFSSSRSRRPCNRLCY